MFGDAAAAGAGAAQQRLHAGAPAQDKPLAAQAVMLPGKEHIAVRGAR